LIVRLAKNQSLLDGNKRVAWVALRMFIEISGWSSSARPSADEAEEAVLAIAAGKWDEVRVADWLGENLQFKSDP